ncbi:MAG: hypothetical protein JSS75_00960 [Bacteroidetes bacterium]|nr:hypothetical protein [Bacteroidota bacterium]
MRYLSVLMIALGAIPSLRAQQSLYRLRLQDSLSHALTLGGPSTGFSSNWTLRFPGSGASAGSLLYASDGAGQLSWLTPGSNTQVLTLVGGVPTWAPPASSGTVTSVGLSLPTNEFTVTNSPVSSSGTLTGSWKTQAQNLVFASPNASTGVPSFRALVAGDIPSLAYVTSVGLSLPSLFTVSGSPVTTSGTLSATLATQSANMVFAGPTTGVAAAPTFRSLVASDIPSLAYVTSVGLSMPSGFTVSNSPITSNGTLAVTTTLNGPLRGNGSGFTTGNLNLASEVTGTLGVTNGGTGTNTQFTQGSVIFAGASGVYSQNNASFFWDNSNSRLGIGTSSPGTSLDINGALTNRETSLAVASNAATIPSNSSQIQLTGAATGTVALTGPTTPPTGQRLVVYNNTTGGNAATLAGYTIPNGQAIEFVYTNGAWRSVTGTTAPTGGTVTSIGLTMPTGFSVANSPITTNGTLAVTTSLNGPLRGNGTGFTTGNTSLTSEVSGILPVANGGTGLNTSATATGSLLYTSSAGTWSTLSPGANTNVLTLVGGVPTWQAPATNGTVTSVGLSMPSIFSVSNSPVTTSGTLTATLATQSANMVFAGPTTGVAAAPTFRSLVASDIPSLAYVTSVGLSMPSGFTVTNSPITSNGTLAVTTTLNGPLRGNGSGFTTGNLNLASEVTGTLGVTNGGTGTNTQFTQGSVIFAGASGVYSQNNASFFWDNSNSRLGIGTSSPGTSLDINGALTNRETSLAVASNAATIGANIGQVRLTGTATGAIALTGPTPTNAGQYLTVYNNTTGGFAATLNGYTIPNGQALEFIYSNGGWRSLIGATSPGGSGTVTSVGLSLPSLFTVSGSPVTTSGTLSATLATQSANMVFAGPTTGVAAAPTFRSLVASDIPSLNYVTSVGLSLPSLFTVSGSPVTTSGTLSATLATQSANMVFAGPTTGVAAAPTFRSLVASDIPSLAYVTSVGLSMPSGFTVTNSPITSNGTLAVTTTLNGPLRGNGSGFTTGNLNLASEVTGTLGVTNGGTGTNTQFTQGSVIFAGASGVYSQNNASFFWDNSNSRLGIGTSSPNTSVDIVKDFATREYNYSTSISGSNNNVNFDGSGNLFGMVRIASASAAFTLTSIAGPQNGKRITIYNASSQSMTLANQSSASGATAANKIITGTGADVTIPSGGTANLLYSATDSRWVVMSSSLGNVSSTGTSLQVTPSDPTGTSSGTGVMMGLGSSASFTPTKSGKVLIIISASENNNAGGNGGQMQIRYGTGSAPSNGAALTGTTAGNLAQGSPSDPSGANSAQHHETIPMTCNAVVSMTVGTTYWIDVSVAQIGGGTAEIVGVSISAIEF